MAITEGKLFDLDKNDIWSAFIRIASLILMSTYSIKFRDKIKKKIIKNWFLELSEEFRRDSKMR